ncbi:MAG: Lrp/AsnC family transcriptional regulator [Myxococcota bacterium]
METDLDRIDIALIRALQKDGRASNKELADVAGLAPSSTHGRVRRLFERGVVRGVHADVDPAAVGVGLEAFIFLRLASHSREAVGTLWQDLCALPEVRAAYYVGGDDDILLHVLARDARHLRDLVLDRISSQSGIARVRTELLFQQHHTMEMPVFTDS